MHSVSFKHLSKHKLRENEISAHSMMEEKVSLEFGVAGSGELLK